MTCGTFGMNLKCSYTTFSGRIWPSHKACKVSNIEFSLTNKLESHTFYGSSSEKSDTKSFWIFNSPNLQFIPVEILSEFSNLNGLIIHESNLTVIKNDLFTSMFHILELLDLYNNNIKYIQSGAFKHLTNLKWIRLYNNKIQSLPFLIFQNNLKLIFIDFDLNEIQSINPQLFKNLNHLKNVDFNRNKCINKNIGCASCSVSQSTLDLDFATCFKDFDSLEESSTFLQMSLESSASSLSESISNDNEILFSNFTSKIAQIQTSLDKSIKETIGSNFKEVALNLTRKTDSIFQETKATMSEIDRKLEENSKVLKKEIENQSVGFLNVTDAMKTNIKSIVNREIESQTSSLYNITENIKNDFKTSIAIASEAAQSAIENLNGTLEEVVRKTEDILHKTVIELDQKWQENMKSSAEFVKNVVHNLTTKVEDATEHNKKSNQDAVEALKEIVLEKTDNKLEKHLQKTDAKIDIANELLISKFEILKLKAELTEISNVKKEEALKDEIKNLKQDVEDKKIRIESLETELKELKEKFEKKVVTIVQEKLEAFEKKLLENSKP
jgi:hypothetical protein